MMKLKIRCKKCNYRWSLEVAIGIFLFDFTKTIKGCMTNGCVKCGTAAKSLMLERIITSEDVD